LYDIISLDVLLSKGKNKSNLIEEKTGKYSGLKEISPKVIILIN
jgi:hypothetical protein